MLLYLNKCLGMLAPAFCPMSRPHVSLLPRNSGSPLSPRSRHSSLIPLSITYSVLQGLMSHMGLRASYCWNTHVKQFAWLYKRLNATFLLTDNCSLLPQTVNMGGYAVVFSTLLPQATFPSRRNQGQKKQESFPLISKGWQGEQLSQVRSICVCLIECEKNPVWMLLQKQNNNLEAVTCENCFTWAK